MYLSDTGTTFGIHADGIPGTCRQPINQGSMMATMMLPAMWAYQKATVSRVLNGTGQVKKARARKFTAMQALTIVAPTCWHARWQIAPATGASVWSSLRLTASILAVCGAGRRAAEP